jgi:hypothetical protein
MKNYTSFKEAQEILEDITPNYVLGSEIHGFNWRLQGYDRRDFDGDCRSYQLADDAINKGLIFYIEPFKCKCGNYRFEYGGGWACNDCQNCISAPKWWHVKVEKDGNAFICKGDGFEDLQISDNYAYGLTRQEALDNYRLLFI